MHITHRRICWPGPDATCLAGACVACSRGRWKRLTTIKRYAKRSGTLPARYLTSGREDALGAFEYGLRHAFFKTPVRGVFVHPEKSGSRRK